MNVVRTDKSPTEVELVITAEPAELESVKRRVAGALGSNLKVPGFRQGKAPSSVAEKHVDPQKLLDEFVNEALNALYGQALTEQNLRPIDIPKLSVTKLVPFTTLEFKVDVPIVGPVKLGKYDSIKVNKPIATVTDTDVKEVLSNLQLRLAEKTEVSRAAKDGDQVWIDFKGTDIKGQPIAGASGKDHPLVISSNTFIPGFEPEIIGMKAGQTKKFDVTFPADYGVAALQKKKVTFEVNVNKVEAVSKPELDDSFAAKAGPFTSVADLKSDIKKQVGAERQQQAVRQYENQLIMALTDASSVEIPDNLIDQQVVKMEDEEKQNLVYRGQTWQEHLDADGITEEQHREQKRPEATAQVKAGLVLSELAEKEAVKVTPEEVEVRIQVLKSQYQDPAMQDELNKPENRQDITARLLTEKTISRLVELNG